MKPSSEVLIQNYIKDFAFEQYGFASLQKPYSLSNYKAWLDNNYYGDMLYLKEHLEQKSSPQKLLPEACSAIVVSKSYLPHPKPKKPVFEHLQIALYALGEDYHFWFKHELLDLCNLLKEKFPDEEFLPLVDSAPVLERDLAQRAGLGWIGKNSCLIHSQYGSLFFIGEIYTSLSLTSHTSPHPDRCGKCRRCIEACPTQAITEERTLDARRCISYLTIEAKSLPSDELAEKTKDWFFGCDICQSICPWNKKTKEIPEYKLNRSGVLEDLRFILKSSNKSLMLHLKDSPLSRSRGFGLKRNALVLIQNLKLTELAPEVEIYLDHERLGPLAQKVLLSLKA